MVGISELNHLEEDEFIESTQYECAGESDITAIIKLNQGKLGHADTLIPLIKEGRVYIVKDFGSIIGLGVIKSLLPELAYVEIAVAINTDYRYETKTSGLMHYLYKKAELSGFKPVGSVMRSLNTPVGSERRTGVVPDHHLVGFSV